MNSWSQALALEQNEKGTRLLIVTRDGRVRGAAYEAHRSLSPQPGWLEYDPAELWYKAKKVIAAGLDIHRTFPVEIAAIGLAAAHGATIVWNADTGEPYYNAIARQDTRALRICQDLFSQGLQDLVHARTGLSLANPLPACNLLWLLDEVPDLRAAAEQGRALFGSVDSWLLWKLTGVHAADYTQAASTGLFDLRTCAWDPELLAAFGIPSQMLPTACPSSDPALFGHTRQSGPFDGEVPVTADLAQPQAACFGLACFSRGDAALGHDLGGGLYVNTGPELLPPPAGWKPTIAFALAPTSPAYALECAAGEEADGRATVERTRECLRALERETGIYPDTVRANPEAPGAEPEFEEGLPGIPVVRPLISEAAALGAAYAAGLAVGFWQDVDELRGLWRAVAENQ